MMNSTTPLLELLEAFCRQRAPHRADSFRRAWGNQYLTSISSFQLSLDHPATIADLNADAIDKWAKSGAAVTATGRPRRGRVAAGSRLAESTIRWKRKRLRTLWRFAASREAITSWPPQSPRKPPVEPEPELPTNTTPNVNPETLLLAYFDSTWTPAKRAEGVKAASIDVIRQSIRWFTAALKRDPTLADLNDEALCKLWRFIRKQGRAPMTASWNCVRIQTVWRFAWKRGDVVCRRPRIAELKKRVKLWKERPRIPMPKGKLRGIPESEAPRGPLTPATLETTLREFAKRHYIESHDIQQSSLDKGFLCAITSFERFLKRPAKIADLTADAMNPWLTSALTLNRRTTVHTYRRMILVLWRYCYEIGVLNEWPRRVKPIRQPGRIIEGYDAAQMATLLRTADALPGVYRRTGIEKRLWWTAFLLTAWATGLRLGDLLRIERDWIKVGDDGSGRLSVVMNKTGNVIHRVLPTIAVAAIDRLMATGDKRILCFPLSCDSRDYFREFKQLAKDAGLSGTTKWIRRGSASEVERLCAGAARYHLGHRSPGMFDMAYRVDRIVGQNIPLPPEPQFVPTLRLTIERKDSAT